MCLHIRAQVGRVCPLELATIRRLEASGADVAIVPGTDLRTSAPGPTGPHLRRDWLCIRTGAPLHKLNRMQKPYIGYYHCLGAYCPLLRARVKVCARNG